MQLLLPPKDTILALPEKASKKDCKMVFLGYKSLINTGGRKKINKSFTQTATATQTAEVMPLDQHNPFAVFSTATPIPDRKQYRETDESLCYCFTCKKTINAIVTENTVNSIVGWHGRIVKMYECPHCGQHVSDDDIFYTNCIYTVYRSYFLDDNKLKIRRKEFMFRWYNNHLIVEDYKHLTTMNLDTGYSYRFPVYKNGKKMSNNLVNCTYSATGIDRTTHSYSNACRNIGEFYSEIYEVVRKYKMENLDIFIPSYEQYREEHINQKNKSKSASAFGLVHAVACKTPGMEDVMMFNRYPTMHPFKTLRNFSNRSFDKEFIKLRRSIKTTTKDPIKDILDFYKMPSTKNTKKRTIANINYPKFFYMLNQVIDNYDNINKLLNEDSIKYMSSYDVESICESLEILKNIKEFNLNSFCNKAAGEERYTVVDTLRLAKQITKKKYDYKFDFKGRLNDIHDKLAKDFNKLKHENQIIEYEEAYKELEGQYGELYFNLAKDTHELIDVGTTMNICVGGYGERAVEKRLNIMVARDADKNPIICIEMDKFYYDLEQTKLKYNHRIQEDTIEYVSIKEWAEKHSLHFDTYDVPDKLKEEHNELELVKRKGERIDALRGVDDTTRPQYVRRAPLRGRPVVNAEAVARPF